VTPPRANGWEEAGAAPRLSASELEALRRLAVLLDAAVEIPGIRVRVGLDALLGLLPGVGDVLSALVPAYTIVHAARRRVPPGVLARMGLNWAIDALIGTIPLLGDLFDIGWKANLRNIDLLERHLARTGRGPEGAREVGR
jgi:hypothetical protein